MSNPHCTQSEINRAVAEALGCAPKEIVGRPVPDFLLPEHRAAFFSEYLPTIRSRGKSRGTIVFLSRDRRKIYVEYVSSLVAEEEEAVYARGSGHDITVLKQAAAALRNSENHLKTIMDSIHSGIVVIDAETHHIVDANPYALKMLGAKREDVISRVCHKFICPAEAGKCPVTDLNRGVENADRRQSLVH